MMRLGEWVIESRDDTTPKEIMLEVTTKCNYSCIHCFRNWLSEGFHDMDLKLFRKIIDEASETGVEWISLSGWGEPLTHPNISYIVRYIKSRDLRLLLNTNGSLLDKHLDVILESGVDKIVVSIDSISEELYKLIRVGGSLPKVEDSLKRIKEIKIENMLRNPEVDIQFTLNRMNMDDLRRLPEYAVRLGVSRIIISNLIPLNPVQEESLSCYKWDKCREVVNRYMDSMIRLGLEHGVDISLPNFNVSYSERSCPFISKYSMFIRYDGKVAPCIYYAHSWKNVIMGVEREINEVIFGDLHKESILSIWRKPEYIKFRFNVFFMRQPSCLDCPLQEYCTLTLSNETDCWGNIPSCAHCPYSRDMTRCPL
ncbi:MAG TPA: tungsten cofactor oxidoreductase radical SAM maturase [Thermoprotei archaeon]|nr:tungsten cofactor oxidoreductase radical SAM maturase [Thermoprotei archaeon]